MKKFILSIAILYCGVFFIAFGILSLANGTSSEIEIFGGLIMFVVGLWLAIECVADDKKKEKIENKIADAIIEEDHAAKKEVQPTEKKDTENK